ncbi:MAG: hypothetical protein IPK16_12640 [Anaerolineales bacterium]|nr:hypothetical protein [Anaerolineales bacterium]
MITFFAVAGLPMESLSITPSALASIPSLPALKVMTMSLLVQMNLSALLLSRV